MKSDKIDTDQEKRVLHPESTETVLLDKYDRHMIEEALLWYADEKEQREEWEQYIEHLAWVVTDF